MEKNFGFNLQKRQQKEEIYADISLEVKVPRPSYP